MLKFRSGLQINIVFLPYFINYWEMKQQINRKVDASLRLIYF